MQLTTTSFRIAGLFFIRALLGVIFFMQGFGKVFIWGVSGVYENIFQTYEETFLPKFLLWFTAYFTSYAEWICGALLLIGLWRRIAIFILGALLLLVSFGHGVLTPIWSLEDVFPRAILLILLFLLPSEWDQWSLDHLFREMARGN